MKKKTLFMGTTKIPVKETVGEIQEILASSGAREILISYGADREPEAVRFQLLVKGGTAPFFLPARKGPVFARLNSNRPPENRDKFRQQDLDQASKTAWRQILRWLMAQLALIQTGMVEPEEVFLPYWVDSSGLTLFRALKTQKFKGLLTDGEDDEDEEDEEEEN